MDSEYYSIICTIAAFLLCFTSISEKRLLFIVMFCEFLACKLAAYCGLTITKELNNELIFIIYYLIQLIALLVISALLITGKSSSIILALLVASSAIVNSLMVAPWYGYTVFGLSHQQMHDIYTNLLGSIMILELLYMLAHNKYMQRLINHGGGNTDNIDSGGWNNNWYTVLLHRALA